LILNKDTFVEIQKLEDKSVDLILTDPPYDFNYDQMVLLKQQFDRISKTGSIIFCPPHNQWVGTPNQYGFWIKPISTKNTSKRYSRFVEMIFFYGDLKWNSKRHWSQYTNVFNDLVQKESDHPFEKPQSLLERLIKNHSDVEDIIFDPFAGSGSTGKVAERLGRKFIGWDIDA